MREQELADKSAQIQQELEVWVRQNNILEPGEQLVFSMKVVGFPTVKADESRETLLSMTVEEFFTPKRLGQYSEEKKLNTRTINAILNAVGSGTTVREFIRRYPSEIFLYTIRDMGQKCVPLVVKVLEPLIGTKPASQ